MSKGRAITSVGRFNQLEKWGNLVVLGAESNFFHSKDMWCRVLEFKRK